MENLEVGLVIFVKVIYLNRKGFEQGERIWG